MRVLDAFVRWVITGKLRDQALRTAATLRNPRNLGGCAGPSLHFSQSLHAAFDGSSASLDGLDRRASWAAASGRKPRHRMLRDWAAIPYTPVGLASGVVAKGLVVALDSLQKSS